MDQHLPASCNMLGVLRRVAQLQVHSATADYYLLHLPLPLLPPTHAATSLTHQHRPIAVPVPYGQPFPFLLPPPARACALCRSLRGYFTFAVRIHILFADGALFAFLSVGPLEGVRAGIAYGRLCVCVCVSVGVCRPCILPRGSTPVRGSSPYGATFLHLHLHLLVYYYYYY